MSPSTNPYEPAASVEKKSYVNEGQREAIERYPLSWKIATLVGLVVGFLTWYARSQFIVMSRSVSWVVQGFCLAIGQLPASGFFRARHRETKMQSIARMLLPSAQFLAIWSIAALADHWLSPQAAILIWNLALTAVLFFDLVLVKRKTMAASQSRRLAIFSLVVYTIAMMTCLVALFV